MKKLLILSGITILGIASFMFINNNHGSLASANTKDKLVLFGKVDLSEDKDDVDKESVDDEKEDSDEGNWLENFIKTHKTPFSKTIHK